jgi:hypothetical protein
VTTSSVVATRTKNSLLTDCFPLGPSGIPPDTYRLPAVR